jgi:hypothetical protein
MAKSKKINVQGVDITIIDQESSEYVSLTDMTKGFDEGSSLIEKWLRNKNTLEFLGVWEVMNNKNFNSPEYEGFKNEAGSNRFLMSVKKWVDGTNAIGIQSKAGRYGGTYAHKDIAYHFGMWISPEFQLLIVKEFDRLKKEESERKEIGWDFQRYLSKVNYHLQTDSIKEVLIPDSFIQKDREWLEYATEADILNVAVFGRTAKIWREENPEKANQGQNIRDLADLHQLTVIANLEAFNATLIRKKIDRPSRFREVVKEAKFQLESLRKSSSYTLGQIQSPHYLTTQTEEVDFEDITDADSKKKYELTGFDKKLKTALEYDPKGKGES